MRATDNPLNKIRIASPCSAKWSEMFGNERKRFCGQCKLNVYNISNMTRPEAERFLLNSEGRICLRVFRRSDGSVITEDCRVAKNAIRSRRSKFLTAICATTIGLLGGLLSQLTVNYINALVDDGSRSGEITIDGNAPRFGISDGILENLPEIKAAISKSLLED